LAEKRRRFARQDEDILVIGLGRFGGSLARELTELGHDVLGVDSSEAVVAQLSPYLAKAVVADTTRRQVLEQLGANDFDHVVVGVGDVEANILTVAELKNMGIDDVWAKAATTAHKRILEAIGVKHVVLPEHEMGRRIAHQVTGKMVDYIELEEGFALVESRVPADMWGQTLATAQVRSKFNVTVVCIKPVGEGFTYATPDTILGAGAMVLVAGDKESVQSFAEQT
jgi:trk system potassium uptake protein TrkA